MPHSLGDLTDVPQAIIDDFFGIWAIEETRFRQAVEKYQGINLVAHIQANRGQINHLVPEPSAANFAPSRVGGLSGNLKDGVEASAGDSRLYSIAGEGVAVIRLRGPMMKYVNSMSDGASTVFARRQLRQAVEDDQVGAILLVLDSPGGTVAGTMDLASEVGKAAAKKPVHAFIDDLTASAAYWVASQATKVFANNPTALVGSIGTFAVLYDYSKAAEQLGVKVHVVKAGDFKGTGVPGTEITEEQIANIQRIVNALNTEFLNGVAKGRNLSLEKVQEIADGRVHPAAEAIGKGLVDDVQSFDETLAGLSNQNRKRRRTYSMTTNENAANLQELKQAIPDADATFLVAQLEKGASIDQALREYAAKIKADNEALQKQLADAEAKHKQDLEEATKAAKPVGVKPLGVEKSVDASDDGYLGATGDPVMDFDNAVREQMKVTPHLGRQRCVLAVARRNPELHQAYLLATNPNRKAARLIAEKYDEAAAG
jgi:signal peptide peptidase SppA